MHATSRFSFPGNSIVHLPHEAVTVAQHGITKLSQPLDLIYLETQKGRMGNYQLWQAAGYPVESGLVERAVAVVTNQRMKKRGMRWKRANATAVLALCIERINAE